MVGTFSQVIEHVEVSNAPRVIRKKIWRNNEWQDLTRYQIQMRTDDSTGSKIDWLVDTYGHDSGKWTLNWGTLTMDEDVYTMFKLRWS